MYGAAGKLHTIEDHVMCHATVESSTNLLKAEICTYYLYSCTLLERLFNVYRLLYVLNRAATHNTSRRTAAGRLIALYIYVQPWYGTARGLRSFRACTPTRMQPVGRDVPCKQRCTSDPQQHLILSSRPLHTNSGCGKREAHINWFMVIPETAAPVTGTTLRTPGPVPADSRQ